MNRTILIDIRVPGEPVPKGRHQVLLRPGRRPHIYTPKETMQYEKTVKWHARDEWRSKPNTERGLEVRILFARHKKAGDLDNLVKSVLDGLNGIVFADDRQVGRLVATQIERDKALEPFTAIQVRGPLPATAAGRLSQQEQEFEWAIDSRK